MTTLVISRYAEDLSWLTCVPGNKYVVDKMNSMENVGREAHSYCWFIHEHYEALQGWYVFCQGNPFDHDRQFDKHVVSETFFGQVLKCGPNGEPHHAGLPIHEIAGALGLPKLKEYEFVAGAQFRVRAEQIQKRPKDWWKLAMSKSRTTHGPWVFERLWKYIMEI